MTLPRSCNEGRKIRGSRRKRMILRTLIQTLKSAAQRVLIVAYMVNFRQLRRPVRVPQPSAPDSRPQGTVGLPYCLSCPPMFGINPIRSISLVQSLISLPTCRSRLDGAIGKNSGVWAQPIGAAASAQATGCPFIGDRVWLSIHVPHSTLAWAQIGHRCGPRAFEV